MEVVRGVGEAGFARVQVVQVEDRCRADLPVAWLEARVAVEDVEGDDEVLVDGELLAAAEEVLAVRPLGAHTRRHRHTVPLDHGIALERQVEECVLADDRIVALQHVQVVWVPQMTAGEGVFAGIVSVAIVAREPRAPAVGDRHLLRRR